MLCSASCNGTENLNRGALTAHSDHVPVLGQPNSSRAEDIIKHYVTYWCGDTGWCCAVLVGI